jgi:hypothetical protein
MTTTPRQEDRPEETEPAEAEAEGEPIAHAPPASKPWWSKLAGAIGVHVREWRDIFVDSYLSFDRRTLGFARIMLGWFLLMDLVRRASVWSDIYSDEGVVPTHLALLLPWNYRTFTILNAFSTRGEIGVLWVIIFVTFLCLLVGYKTKLAQILSLIFVTGMNVRVGQIINGGYVAHNLLVLWTCFLPLGERFSLDAMLASMKRKREASADELNDRSDVLTPAQEAPYVSLLGLVLAIQLATIYFFNVVHKTGPPWRNGTAVHFVLYVDRMVNPIIGLVRDYIPNWMIYFLTRSSLVCEAVIPVAVLSPLGRVWARRLAIAMINYLHIGFGVAMVLGPFAWSCCVFSTLLFTAEDWELASRTMRRERRARVVLFNPRSGGALLVCRILRRLDRFELLTFKEASALPLGIAIQGEGDTVIERSEAFADIIAALPLGPSVAWLLRAPGLTSAWNALFAWLEKPDLSRFFGLRIGPNVVSEEPSPVRRRLGQGVAVLREFAIVMMFATAVNRAGIDLPVISKRWQFSQPELFLTLGVKAGFLQGWNMFSPWPVMVDGTIVVDALTVDGRHLDPFTRKEPDFDIGKVKSYGYTQIWSDYFNRMNEARFMGFRDAMRDYMLRLPERTGHPEDALVSGDVYWVQDKNPRWNETVSYDPERLKVFSFQNPNLKASTPP